MSNQRKEPINETAADTYRQESPSSVEDESSSLLPKTAVYGRRWYILALFSSLALFNCLVWNTWGPISHSTEAVFGWSDGTVGLAIIIGSIAHLFFMPFGAWLMDTKGLRVSILFVIVLNVAGAGIRCVTSHPPLFTWLVSIGQFLNGIGGTVLFSGAPLLSSTWFPPNQRTTATAIATIFNYLGLSLSFLVGPLVVDESNKKMVKNSIIGIGLILLVLKHVFDESIIKSSSLDIFSEYHSLEVSNRSKNHTGDIAEDRNNIMLLLYAEAGITVFLSVIAVLYFPAKPPSPPSLSAATERRSFKDGFWELMKHGNAWLIILTYAIPVGIYEAWSTVISICLRHLLTQEEAGWLAFYSSLVGCVFSFMVSCASDKFSRKVKRLLIILFLLSSGCFLWFDLICAQYIPFDKISLYASCILASSFLNGTIPLLWELSCELAYPVAEGITTGILTMANIIPCVLYPALLYIPNIGVSWMNWVVLGAVSFGLPLLLCMKEKYNRTSVDINE